MGLPVPNPIINSVSHDTLPPLGDLGITEFTVNYDLGITEGDTANFYRLNIQLFVERSDHIGTGIGTATSEIQHLVRRGSRDSSVPVSGTYVFNTTTSINDVGVFYVFHLSVSYSYTSGLTSTVVTSPLFSDESVDATFGSPVVDNDTRRAVVRVTFSEAIDVDSFIGSDITTDFILITSGLSSHRIDQVNTGNTDTQFDITFTLPSLVTLIENFDITHLVEIMDIEHRVNVLEQSFRFTVNQTEEAPTVVTIGNPENPVGTIVEQPITSSAFFDIIWTDAPGSAFTAAANINIYETTRMGGGSYNPLNSNLVSVGTSGTHYRLTYIPPSNSDGQVFIEIPENVFNDNLPAFSDIIYFDTRGIPATTPLNVVYWDLPDMNVETSTFTGSVLFDRALVAPETLLIGDLRIDGVTGVTMTNVEVDDDNDRLYNLTFSVPLGAEGELKVTIV